MVGKVPLITLNNGKKIPQLGLGTWNVSKSIELCFFLCNYIMTFFSLETPLTSLFQRLNIWIEQNK